MVVDRLGVGKGVCMWEVSEGEMRCGRVEGVWG